ncbi:MAG: HAMP domain-containing sensor histidine kinase [Thermoleophilaceae bacterium]
MPLRRPRLRSLRNKLALVFFAITATAFAVLYFFVVPQLEANLVDRRLDELERVARGARPTLETLTADRDATTDELNRRVQAVSDAAGARVTLFGVQSSAVEEPRADAVQFFVVYDSREERSVPDDRSLAARAVLTREPARGRGEFRGEPLAQLAQPLSYRGRIARVALYTQTLTDASETVSFIRNRLLLAAGVALLLALIGVYLVAQALARRVKRLDQGAQEVAAGRFIEPLPVDSQDELGQLTATFNDMQRQLRRLDVARKEFVATASHELRTPIFSLGGFVELLQDEELDEETRREFLDTMAEQVERLQKLAVDLLDLSRLDAGSVALDNQPVDIGDLARTIVGEFRPAVTRHETQLDLRLPARIEAQCDRERVAQIMRILLDNALRHTPEGTHVTVTAGRHNGSAELTVSDNGPGLTDEDKVFERFYTGDATRGAGLGLAIARELAERMDGSIRAARRPGGTSFTLQLPAGRSRS